MLRHPLVWQVWQARAAADGVGGAHSVGRGQVRRGARELGAAPWQPRRYVDPYPPASRRTARQGAAGGGAVLFVPHMSGCVLANRITSAQASDLGMVGRLKNARPASGVDRETRGTHTKRGADSGLPASPEVRAARAHDALGRAREREAKARRRLDPAGAAPSNGCVLPTDVMALPPAQPAAVAAREAGRTFLEPSVSNQPRPSVGRL